jgi:mono/diheme cytochrome c family protein/peroxiredoxin
MDFISLFARNPMSGITLRIAICVCLAMPISAPALTKPDTNKINTKIENLSFTTVQGKTISLKDTKAVAVVFLSFDCPVSNSYIPLLTELTNQYRDKGVLFIGAVASDQSPAEIAKLADEFKIGFPICRDEKLALVDALKATHTPEAFVLDHNLVLRYRGRIDDKYSERLKANPRVTTHNLKDAVEALLAGKAVAEPTTVAVGCGIFQQKQTAKDGKVTYYRDVLPILQNRCQECHRPGEVGPFSLLTYKQAVVWGADIKDYTQSRKMPPWKPVGGPGYKHERTMPEAEINKLAAWVDSQMPEGDPKDAPPTKEFAASWQLGKPDLILSVSEDFHVGASGPDQFRCFVLPTGLTEDKMIVAYQVRPGNPRIVHHSINFFDTTGQARERDKKERERERKPDEPDRGPGYSSSMGIGFISLVPGAIGGVGGWTPGLRGFQLPEGTGYLLPKNSDIVMQIHYHRNGRPEVDRTQIGLYFAKDDQMKSLKQLKLLTVPGIFSGTKELKRWVNIPAGESSYRVVGKVVTEQDCTIHSILPHMHMFGKSIKVTMTPPEGKEQVIVNVPDWDYSWQESYFFQKPIAVKKGTRFMVEATFDNSVKNTNNPFNPPRDIKRGEQTTDEMLFGFIRATTDTPGDVKTNYLTDRKDYQP